MTTIKKYFTTELKVIIFKYYIHMRMLNYEKNFNYKIYSGPLMDNFIKTFHNLLIGNKF
jgi:hypothetical protein